MDLSLSRRALLAGVGTAAVGGLAGCSGGESDSLEGVTPARVPPVRRTTPPLPISTLEVRHQAVADDGPAAAAMNRLVAAFEQRQKTVTVRQVPPDKRPDGQLTATVERERALLDYGRAGQALAARSDPERSRDLSGVWEDRLDFTVPGGVTDSCYLGMRLVAVPLELHRVNCLYYNPAVVERAGVDPHAIESVAGLVAQAEALADVVETPLAAPGTPTTLLALWESLLGARIDSLGTFLQLLSWSVPDHRPKVAGALSDLDTLLGVASAPAGERSVLDAVVSESVGFVQAPSWAAQSLIARPDAAFGENWAVAAVPGTDGSFVFSANAFSVPRRTNRLEVVEAFLALASSPALQRRFNEIRGSIPPRRDVAAEMSGHEFYATQSQAYRWASVTLPSMAYGLAVASPARQRLLNALVNFQGTRDREQATEQIQAVFEER